jgi:hypothetical protein
MGHLQNLKKRLNDWVDITLAELCSAYIKQLARQTSKKQDNCSSMESLPNNLTTVHPDTIIAISSQDTSEKITMELTTTEEAVVRAREWSIDRLDNGNLSYEDQQALLSEFEEWIDPPDFDLEIMALEPLEEYFKD